MVPSALDNFREPHERGRPTPASSAPNPVPENTPTAVDPTTHPDPPPDIPNTDSPSTTSALPVGNSANPAVSVQNEVAFTFFLLGITGTLCLTVLVPWLIGRFLLRDSLIHVRSAGTYDILARSNGTYFLSDWVGGCLVLASLCSLVLIARGLIKGNFSLVVGLLVVVLVALVLFPLNLKQWATAEAETVVRLDSTIAPSLPPSCEVDGFTYGDEVAPEDRIEVLTVKNEEGICTGIRIFHGWKPVAQYRMAPGEIVNLSDADESSSVDVHLFPGKEIGKAWVVLSTSKGRIVGFNALNPKKRWSVSRRLFLPSNLDYELGNLDMKSPQTAYVGNTFLTLRSLGTRDQYVEGIDPQTGKTKWTRRCPAPDGFASSLIPAEDWHRKTAIFDCISGVDADGVVDFIDVYKINEKGTMKIISKDE